MEHINRFSKQIFNLKAQETNEAVSQERNLQLKFYPSWSQQATAKNTNF